MPGMTLYINPMSAAQEFVQKFSDAQQVMIHDQCYESQIELSKDGICMGHVSYSGYPIKFFNHNGTVVGIEGRIYNKPKEQWNAELSEIAEKIFNHDVDPSGILGPWTQGAEGEYVIMMLSPGRKKLVVFTDPLGRLPLYYYKDDSSLILARECKFIEKVRGKTEYDRIGCAQFLLTGYPLGKRTLFEGISRAPGGMILSAAISKEKVDVRVASLYTFNFDDVDSGRKSVKHYAEELADLFVDTCKYWGGCQDVSNNVLSLSGGQDSRAVAAAMVKAEVPILTVTFSPEGTVSSDARVAKSVANVLEVPHHRFSTPKEVKRSDMERLVRMKDGLNFVGMASIISFLEYIVSNWGRDALYITGDGGDKVFPDLSCIGKYNSIAQLTDAIVGFNSHFDAGLAESVFGLAPGVIADEFRTRLSEYPESGLAEKSIHYSIYERGRKWLYEGEDRSRFFLWATSPFYAFNFFKEAMQMPRNLKTGFAFCREFQIALSRQCAQIVDASSKYPISSFMPFRFKSRLRTWASARFPDALKKIVKSISPSKTTKLISVSDKQLAGSLYGDNELAEIIPPDAIDRIFLTQNYFAVKNLLTLLLAAKQR